MHHWSDKELLRYYEERLEEGVVNKKGSTYSRMLEFKERLDKRRRSKTIERMRKANRLIKKKYQCKCGKVQLLQKEQRILHVCKHCATSAVYKI